MSSDSAARIVRERLAAADRLRRGREAMRQVWRTAPLVAALGLGLAALSRVAGVPAAVPLLVLVGGAGALALFALLRRRTLPVSDAAAAAIDHDAGTAGELRSANWFGAREQRDAWADFHLLKAAERLQGIDWAELYPATRSGRAQAATLVLVTAAAALMLTVPERVSGDRGTVAASKAVAASGPVSAGRVLDPELQRQLEALLAAAANDTLPTVEALASDAELRAMLDRLSLLSDAELLEALERALAANPDALTQSSANNMKRLAEEAKHAAEAGTLPRELQQALEKLSDEIELVNPDEGVPGENANAASSAGSQGQMGEGDGPAEQLSIQFARAAEAGGGGGVLMMSSPEAGQPGGPPGAGTGGAGSDDVAGSSAASIEAALKQESVEASQDTPGDNVDTETRRITERGNATVVFTGRGSATFDRTRAAAPPPVPEGRRTGVQTYFVRPPQ